MSLGLGARPLGMGGAFVAVSDDATAPYWNPAGGVQGEGRELFGMHSESFGSIVKLDGIAYLQSAGSRGALGLYFTRLGVEGIALTDSTGKDPNFPIEITKRVNAEDLLFALTYAQMQGKIFSWGGNVKFVRRDTGTNTALGTGVDLGGLFWLKEGITIGVNLQDLTTTIITWDTGQKDYILPTVKTGIALKREIEFPKGDLLFAMDVDIKFENRGGEASQFTFGRGSGDLHLGAEYLFRKALALRVGSDMGRFTLGVGILYKTLKFDYAFFNHEDLGGSSRISGSINF
ncbi:PorV/PorQ family protein [candidate division TA06 bacterium]|nr:PorV/PorQ family protein [candidate division TA06 bacterium]